MTARFLHDRFCKFEAPLNPASDISIFRRILQINSNIEFLKQIDLPFKLNSLAWFLTPKGKEFLTEQWKRYQLDKKIEEIYKRKESIKEIAAPIISDYTKKIDEEKFGEDRE